MVMLRLRPLGVICLLALAACYSHRPINGSLPASNTRITAELTDSGSLALSQTLGPAATDVEGIVASADQAGITLNVLRVQYRGGTSMTWTREPVRFPASALRNIRERRLDRTRSWMAGGLVTLGAVLIATVAGIVSGDDPGPTPPPPPIN